MKLNSAASKNQWKSVLASRVSPRSDSPTDAVLANPESELIHGIENW